MSAEWFAAICAGVTLLIVWSTTIIGGAVWLMRQLSALKTTILEDFDAKHRENSQKVEALTVLVTRHELILEPEFRSPVGKDRQHRAS